MSRRKVKDKIKGLNKLGNGVFGLGLLGSVVGRKVEGDLKEGRRNIEALMKQQVLLNSLNAVLMFDDVGQLNEFLLENHEQMVEVLKTQTHEQAVDLFYNTIPNPEKKQTNPEEYRKNNEILVKIAEESGKLPALQEAGTIKHIEYLVSQGISFTYPKRVVRRDEEKNKVVIDIVEQEIDPKFLEDLRTNKKYKGANGQFSLKKAIPELLKEFCDNPIKFKANAEAFFVLYEKANQLALEEQVEAIKRMPGWSEARKDKAIAKTYSAQFTNNIKLMNDFVIAGKTAEVSHIGNHVVKDGKVVEREIPAITMEDVNQLIHRSFVPAFNQMAENPENKHAMFDGLLESVSKLNSNNSNDGNELFTHIKSQFNNFAYYYLESKRLYGEEDGSLNFGRSLSIPSRNPEEKFLKNNCTWMKHLIAMPYIQEAVKTLTKDEFLELFGKLGIKDNIVDLVYEQALHLDPKVVDWVARQGHDQQSWIALNGSTRQLNYGKELLEKTKENLENEDKLNEALSKIDRVNGKELKSGVQNSRVFEEKESENANTTQYNSNFDKYNNGSVEEKEKIVHKEIREENARLEQQKVEQNIYESEMQNTNNDVYVANSKPLA